MRLVRRGPQPPGPAGAASLRLTADRVMAEIQRFGRAAGMINLAHAEPDARLIPAAAFWSCLAALRDDPAAHLQYVSPQGDRTLREQIALLLGRRGIEAGADVEKVNDTYRRRRDAMLAALEATMPEGVRWTRPQGGFSTWLSLPEEVGMEDLYRAALREGVVFAPGDVFLVENDAESHLRLCFGGQEEAVIRRSVSRLARLIEDRLQRLPAQEPLAADGAPLV